MDSLASVSTETEELTTMARMLTYIRDSARLLDAPAVEYCIDMAMKAVSDELNSRDGAKTSPDKFEIVLRQLQ